MLITRHDFEADDNALHACDVKIGMSTRNSSRTSHATRHKLKPENATHTDGAGVVVAGGEPLMLADPPQPCVTLWMNNDVCFSWKIASLSCALAPAARLHAALLLRIKPAEVVCAKYNCRVYQHAIWPRGSFWRHAASPAFVTRPAVQRRHVFEHASARSVTPDVRYHRMLNGGD